MDLTGATQLLVQLYHSYSRIFIEQPAYFKQPFVISQKKLIKGYTQNQDVDLPVPSMRPALHHQYHCVCRMSHISQAALHVLQDVS